MTGPSARSVVRARCRRLFSIHHLSNPLNGPAEDLAGPLPADADQTAGLVERMPLGLDGPQDPPVAIAEQDPDRLAPIASMSQAGRIQGPVIERLDVEGDRAPA